MLGDELRKAREKTGLTQEQLSFAANIDRSYISQLENNRKSPTIAVLFRLCDALSVSAAKIIARVEKSRQPNQKKP